MKGWWRRLVISAKERLLVRVPVRTLELKDLDPGYEGYFVKIPRSVKEGWIHDMAKTRAAAEDKSDEEQGRASNIGLFELVVEWNLDSDKTPGTILPLISACKTPEKKAEVLAEIPIEVILWIAQQVSGGATVPEAVTDFSKGS